MGGGRTRFDGGYRGRTLPGTTGSDGCTTTGEDAEAPDAVDALERVGGLRGSLETIGGIRAAGEFELGAQADTLEQVVEMTKAQITAQGDEKARELLQLQDAAAKLGLKLVEVGA